MPGADRVKYKNPGSGKEADVQDSPHYHEPLVNCTYADGPASIPIGDKNHIDTEHYPAPKSEALKKLFGNR